MSGLEPARNPLDWLELVRTPAEIRVKEFG